MNRSVLYYLVAILYGLCWALAVGGFVCLFVMVLWENYKVSTIVHLDDDVTLLALPLGACAGGWLAYRAWHRRWVHWLCTSLGFALVCFCVYAWAEMVIRGPKFLEEFLLTVCAAFVATILGAGLFGLIGQWMRKRGTPPAPFYGESAMKTNLLAVLTWISVVLGGLGVAFGIAGDNRSGGLGAILFGAGLIALSIQRRASPRRTECDILSLRGLIRWIRSNYYVRQVNRFLSFGYSDEKMDRFGPASVIAGWYNSTGAGPYLAQMQTQWRCPLRVPNYKSAVRDMRLSFARCLSIFLSLSVVIVAADGNGLETRAILGAEADSQESLKGREAGLAPAMTHNSIEPHAASRRPAEEVVKELESRLKISGRASTSEDFIQVHSQIAALVDELRRLYPNDHRVATFLPERW